jgi:uncharacterized membrane protein YcaP (DUF421 family)
LALNYAVVRFLFTHPKFDRIVEGEPTPLVEHGQMDRGRMQRELVTRAELEIAAHRQGYATLEAIDTAVLEPSGVISFVGKEPPPAEVLRDELTSRMDAIGQQLAELRSALAARG